MALKRQGIPETPLEMADKDKIVRGILLGLLDQDFSVGMLTNGEVVVSMDRSDYTIKVTKKKVRIM